MKIMGWVESVTFMAVVAVVSTLLRSGALKFVIFLINSSTAYISKDLFLIKHLLYDLKREHSEQNMDEMQILSDRYLS